MGLSLFEFIAICAGVLVCFHGVYKCGVGAGFHEGVESGYTMFLKGLCDGDIKIDGRTIIFDESNIGVYNPETDEFVGKLNMDDIEFH